MQSGGGWNGCPRRRPEGAKIDLATFFARQLSEETDGGAKNLLAPGTHRTLHAIGCIAQSMPKSPILFKLSHVPYMPCALIIDFDLDTVSYVVGFNKIFLYTDI